MCFVANSKPRTNMTEAAKKPSAKKAPEHPKYVDMITAAIGSLKERTGSSRQAILKYIQANYKVGDAANSHLKMALKRGVASGAFAQAKGTGASGSFKLVKKAAEPKKKKPAAKKAAKKTPSKKPVAVKKTTVKKSPKKKKPAAKKTAAKKTPKKAAAKKPAAKKPAAKKAPKAKKTPKKSAKK